ncbi:MAG: hypothetical protein ACE5J5_04800 [Candidatus Hydrothermarchaeales archaeon]
MSKIEKTGHYRRDHEKQFPFDEVVRFVKTVKGKKIGENGIKFSKRTKNKEFYVFCLVDKKRNVLKVLNAKKRLKKKD